MPIANIAEYCIIFAIFPRKLLLAGTIGFIEVRTSLIECQMVDKQQLARRISGLATSKSSASPHLDHRPVLV